MHISVGSGACKRCLNLFAAEESRTSFAGEYESCSPFPFCLGNRFISFFFSFSCLLDAFQAVALRRDALTGSEYPCGRVGAVGWRWVLWLCGLNFPIFLDFFKKYVFVALKKPCHLCVAACCWLSDSRMKLKDFGAREM